MNKPNGTKAITFEVIRAHQFSNGGVTFDITINDVSIYGCRVVEGKNGDFISFPQRQGNDGKYYSIAWIKLDAETTSKIIGTIEKML